LLDCERKEHELVLASVYSGRVMAALEHDPDAAVRALLTDALINGIGDTLNDGAGVVPANRESLVTLIKMDMSIVFDAAQWGPSDTCVRDKLADLVAQRLGVANHWPVGADDIDIEAFGKQVNDAARAAGWHVADYDGPWPGL